MAYYMCGFQGEDGKYSVLVVDPHLKKRRKTLDKLRFEVSADLWDKIREPLEAYVTSQHVSLNDVCTFINRIVHPSPQVFRRWKSESREHEFVLKIQEAEDFQRRLPVTSTHFPTEEALRDWVNTEFESSVQKGMHELRLRLRKRFPNLQFHIGAGFELVSRSKYRYRNEFPVAALCLHIFFDTRDESYDEWEDELSDVLRLSDTYHTEEFRHYLAWMAQEVFSVSPKDLVKRKKYTPIFPWGVQRAWVQGEHRSVSRCDEDCITLAFPLR